MIFAKVDVSVPRHHRFLRVPKALRAAALGVWVTALCYTRSEELDGFVPLEAIEAIASDEVVEWLIRVGLFARTEQDGIHGFELLKYAKHNETKEEIEGRKAFDRGRKRKGIRSEVNPDSVRSPDGFTRTGLSGIPGSDSDSDSDSEIREGERERESASAVAPAPAPAPAESACRVRSAVGNATADGCFGEAVRGWCDGIAKVTERPFVAPRGAELAKLVDAFDAHGPTDLADREAWASATAEAYARARTGERLSVHGFVDWLNSGRPARAAPVVGGSGIRRALPADHNPNPVQRAPAPPTGEERERLIARARREADALLAAESAKAAGGTP